MPQQGIQASKNYLGNPCGQAILHACHMCSLLLECSAVHNLRIPLELLHQVGPALSPIKF